MTEKTNCFFCGGETTENDYCYGCHVPICEECSNWNSVAERSVGPHEPEDHMEEVEDD